MQSFRELPSLFPRMGGQENPQHTRLYSKLVPKILLAMTLAASTCLIPILTGDAAAQTAISTSSSATTSCHSSVSENTTWHTALYQLDTHLYADFNNKVQPVGTFILTLFYCQRLDSFFARILYLKDAGSDSVTWPTNCSLRADETYAVHCSNATIDDNGYIYTDDYADTQALSNNGHSWNACWNDRVVSVCTPSFQISGSQSYHAPTNGYQPDGKSMGMCGPSPYVFDGSSHTCDLVEQSTGTGSGQPTGNE